MATRARRTSARKRTTTRLLVLSGPNLDRLGKREPAIYGRETLTRIHERVTERAAELGVEVDCRQSNHEGTLVDWVGAAEDEGFSALVINPGAYTHYSYALHDAIRGAGLLAVEVHLSNPDAREEFRRTSVIAPACAGRIAGFGGNSYLLAIEGAVQALAARRAR